MTPTPIAKTFVVRGRVQGVGFRYFVERTAQAMALRGSVRNLDNGDVEVYAIGTSAQLSELAGRLWQGPRFAEVRGVEEKEGVVQSIDDFRMER